MNRRKFFASLAQGVAGISLLEAIPFNRVWSFPKKIIIPKPNPEAFKVLHPEFHYAYYNPKTGVVSPVLIATGYEASIVRQMVISGWHSEDMHGVALIERE